MNPDWKEEAIGESIEVCTIGGILVRLAPCHVEGLSDLDNCGLARELLNELYGALETALSKAPEARA